jgi:hypothetical protein
MRVIIAGSRSFNDYQLLESSCDMILQSIDKIEIVSGTANGADKLGESYATKHGYEIKRFPAEWDKHGKSAGYIRNEEMAKYADQLIAFWDGKSKGTMHMINLAKKYNLDINIVHYE